LREKEKTEKKILYIYDYMLYVDLCKFSHLGVHDLDAAAKTLVTAFSAGIPDQFHTNLIYLRVRARLDGLDGLDPPAFSSTNWAGETGPPCSQVLKIVHHFDRIRFRK
jgi:hypothetical protein